MKASPSVVFSMLCLSALLLGTYMATAPVAGRPNYFEAFTSAGR